MLLSRQQKSRKTFTPRCDDLESRCLLSQVPGTWAAVAPLPTARYNLGVATGTNGTIYAIGGYSNSPVSAYGTPSSKVDAYNPTTNTWTQVASLPTARGELATATSTTGTVYAIGGGDGFEGTITSEVDAYNRPCAT